MHRILFIFSLSALVFAIGCGSGGSNGPTGPHSNPDALTFTYCRVTEVNSETHVQWCANHLTTGLIQFGQAILADTLRDTLCADTHDVVMVGLQFSTRYLYQLTIRDTSGHSAMRSGAFTTPAKSDTNPDINGIQITNITENSATVSWRTDVPATTILYYGQITLTDSVGLDSLTYQHQVALSRLHSASTYWLRPEAVDSSGRRGIGSDTLFATTAAMSIWSPDTTVALGDTIRLPISVAGAQDLAALHLGLSFTPGSIEVISLDQGPFYSQRQGFIFFPDIRNSSGEVFADMTWSILFQNGQRQGTDADGGGIVAYATLRGLTTGSTQFAFLSDSCFSLDMFAVAHACSLRAGTVEVGP